MLCFELVDQSQDKYPNYILEKGNNFDPVRPFKVKSVDGYAMLLNLKKLKKINNFNFFDENFFLYLENEDLCKRLKDNGENIYIVPSAKIHHLGGRAVDPQYKNEIEYLRNWHWMWSKFYFNKKNFGFIKALRECLMTYLTSIVKFIFYFIIRNNFKKKIYFNRTSGFYNALTGKSSWYRPNLND